MIRRALWIASSFAVLTVISLWPFLQYVLDGIRWQSGG